MTRVTARGERKGTSCRSSGGAHNALKSAGGLWHALFQWFVNELVITDPGRIGRIDAFAQGAGDEKQGSGTIGELGEDWGQLGAH